MSEPILQGCFFAYVEAFQTADGKGAVLIKLKPAPSEPKFAELVGTQVIADENGIELRLMAEEGLSVGNRVQLASIVAAQGGEGKSLFDGERLFFAHKLQPEPEVSE